MADRTGVGPFGCTAQLDDDEMPLAVVRLASPSPGDGALAVLDVAERRGLVARLGPGAADAVRSRLAAVAAVDARHGERLSVAADGALVLLLPDASEEEAEWRLEEVARLVAQATFAVAGNTLRLTPLIGWTPRAVVPDDGAALASAREALVDAALVLDLRPVRRSA